MMKKLLLTAIFTVAILFLFHMATSYALAADDVSREDRIAVREINMVMETATVRVNQERTLVVEILPFNATNQDVEWTTGDPEIATVDPYGTVTGISPGTVEITATVSNGRHAVCIVTVPDSVLTGIELQAENSGHPHAGLKSGEVLSAAAIRLDVENAAKEEKSDQITVTYADKTKVSAAALRAAAFTAGYNGKKALLRFRTLGKDGAIQGQLVIDPQKKWQGDGDIELRVYTEAFRTETAAERAAEYFGVPARVVRLSQAGNFPMSVDVAAKIDISGLDTDSIMIYHRLGSAYTLIDNQNYNIDKSGFIHFSTTKGGTFILVSKPE